MKLISLFFLLSTAAFAQQVDSLNMKTQPKGGKAALQIVYYRIDFTQEETDYLRTHSSELIFSVTDKGVANLEKVNDIGMQSIVDSMMRVNDRLPGFYPERVNGRAETGIYFLKLAWPNYESPSVLNTPYQPYQYIQQYYSPYMKKLSDFSEITYRGPRYDMLVGALIPGFGGNIGRNIDRGWGTKFDFIFYGNKGWGGGFGTTFIIGKPSIFSVSQPIRSQARNHMITLFTGSVGKLFKETRVGQVAMQVEPGFGMTDIVGNDQSKVLGLGFTPGATLIYMLPIGPGRMSRQYFMPVVYRQYLSFHLSARQLMFNVSESRGTIYEIGLSWRLSSRPVTNYKLKESVN